MARLTRICRKCGAKIFSDAPEGLCTGCVLETALGSFADTVAGATDATYADDAARGEDARTLETSVHVAAMLGELGDYELLEEIGRGGQGVVFRARQKSLNRNVALKVIGLGQWATPAHLKRFRLEAEAAASLDHPYIVPIYEVGEQDGQCYFSMKFIEGGQLDEVVKHTPISIRQAAELMAKVARTVHYAHEHGILHRDIKPGNILLDAKGEAHLTDFGLARLVESESTVTRTLEVLGTPSYMAPEQAAGDNAKLTRATDVYGLGAVLYQLLTGHPPFAGGTTYETIKLLLETEPRQPRLWNPKIDRDLSTICLKCLGKDPQRRYSSALALAEDLERWLKHEPIRARRTGVLTRGKKWVRRNPTTTVLTALLVALLAAISVIIWKSELAGRSPITGIAVLPFENASNDPNTEYLSEGISEALINSLSELQQLRVIARPTAFHYKRKDVDPRQVGRELGAAAVLTGKVRQMQDALNVQVDLLDAATGAQIWGAGYDRKIADLVAVKQAIAQEVTAKLKLKLSGEEQRRLVKRDSTNAEAYQFYLRGRYFWNKRTSDGLKTAISYFSQAIGKDPAYGPAYAGLADAYAVLPNYSQTPGREAYPKAEAAALKALELDDELGEAHVSLANIRLWHKWGNGAEAEFKRGLQLNPNYSTAHQWYSIYLSVTGRQTESIAEMEKAKELDPFSLIINTEVGCPYLYAKQYDRAVESFRKAIEMDSDFPFAHFALAEACDRLGRYKEALDEHEKALAIARRVRAIDMTGNDAPRAWYALTGPLQNSYLAVVGPSYWPGRLETARKSYQAGTTSASEVAGIYSILGDREQAFFWLETAYRESDDFLVFLNIQPQFENLRSDPRFRELIQRIFHQSPPHS
jgi:serine/threonine protein kinase/tetratricopeptide (TPR) repeat protein